MVQLKAMPFFVQKNKIIFIQKLAEITNNGGSFKVKVIVTSFEKQTLPDFQNFLSNSCLCLWSAFLNNYTQAQCRETQLMQEKGP